jgi:aminopeptidase N
MAAISTIIAGAALATAGASSYMSAKNAKKQAKAQNQALDYQRKQDDLAAARQKRDAIRAARVARAQAETAGANQGVLDSSSSLGGVGSIQSQLGSNISFLDQWNAFSDQASMALGRANTYGARAQSWSNVASASMTVFNNSDVIGPKVQKIFGKH